MNECPICFDHFPASVLARHASQCSGKPEGKVEISPAIKRPAKEIVAQEQVEVKRQKVTTNSNAC